MEICILDTETTGLTPETGQCIEVAVVRYSLKHRAVVESMSQLFYADHNPLEHINHIPSEILLGAILDSDCIWRQVEYCASECEAIIAHNAEFDQQWVPNELLAWPWICTCHGVDWPLQTKPGSSLVDLALAHGLAVVDPHRALSDCLLLARLLNRCAELGHDVEAMLRRGLRPKGEFKADVSFADKERAKQKGFKWDPARKIWHKSMAVEDATRENLGFDVVRLDQGGAP